MDRITSRAWKRLVGLVVASLAMLSLVSCGTPWKSSAVQSQGPTPKQMLALLSPPPPTLPHASATTQLPGLDQQAVPLTIQPRPQAAASDKVQLRLLVIAADTSDFMLPAWTKILDRLATPYDVFIASQKTLTYDQLVTANGVGKYDAILITTNQLVYSPDGGTTWANAFTADEWNALWQYERDYNVREVDFYTYPSTYPQDFCLQNNGALVTNATPLDTTLTSAGDSVFGYLNSGATVPIQYAYVYKATVRSGCSATPLLVDASGDVLAVSSTSTDGRERIAVTAAENPYLLFTQLLGYGLVQWATRGVYMGDLRFVLKTDVDDWGLAGDERLPNGTICTDDPTFPYTSTCPPFRLSAADALATGQQQANLHSTFPLASSFKLDIAFNGQGLNPNAPLSCDPNVQSVDPLSSATRCLANTFNWIDHTYSHPFMESENYKGSLRQIRKNDNIASAMNLSYSPNFLKTGDFSGLGWYYSASTGTCPTWSTPPWGAPNTDFGLSCSNAAMLRAAKKLGVQYLESNNSIASHQAPCLSCGIRHPLQPDIMLIPDWPDNIHYWATTPDELVSSYNAIYGPNGITPYFSHDLSYQEILAEESTIALYHLQTTLYPHYFHEENLRQYAPGQSLIFDWLDALLTKYSSYYRMPLLTPTWPKLADYIAQRTVHTEAMTDGAVAVWDRATGTVSITAPSATPKPTPATSSNWTLFVTGVQAGQTVNYGGDTISMLTLAPGQSASGTVVTP